MLGKSLFWKIIDFILVALKERVLIQVWHELVTQHWRLRYNSCISKHQLYGVEQKVYGWIFRLSFEMDGWDLSSSLFIYLFFFKEQKIETSYLQVSLYESVFRFFLFKNKIDFCGRRGFLFKCVQW